MLNTSLVLAVGDTSSRLTDDSMNVGRGEEVLVVEDIVVTSDLLEGTTVVNHVFVGFVFLTRVDVMGEVIDSGRIDIVTFSGVLV